MVNESHILQSWTSLETVEDLCTSPATHQMDCKMAALRTFPMGRYRRYSPSYVLEWLRSGASIGDACRAEGRAP